MAILSRPELSIPISPRDGLLLELTEVKKRDKIVPDVRQEIVELLP
jgi:hypothetical protein